MKERQLHVRSLILLTSMEGCSEISSDLQYSKYSLNYDIIVRVMPVSLDVIDALRHACRLTL